MTSVYKFLLRTTTLVGAMTLISRVLGLVRDVLIARLFGAGIASDAFFVAFKIPNFFEDYLLKGHSLKPLYRYLQSINNKYPREPGALDRLCFRFNVGSALFAIVLVGILCAHIYLDFRSRFCKYGEKFELSVLLLRITFLYLLFISLTASRRSLKRIQRFAVPALTPALLNVSLIICAICLSPRLDSPLSD